jgi:hypothetical protein
MRRGGKARTRVVDVVVAVAAATAAVAGGAAGCARRAGAAVIGFGSVGDAAG